MDRETLLTSTTQKLKHHHHYHVSIDDVILTLIFAEIMDQFGEGFPAKNT